MTRRAHGTESGVELAGVEGLDGIESAAGRDLGRQPRGAAHRCVGVDASTTGTIELGQAVDNRLVVHSSYGAERRGNRRRTLKIAPKIDSGDTRQRRRQTLRTLWVCRPCVMVEAPFVGDQQERHDSTVPLPVERRVEMVVWDISLTRAAMPVRPLSVRSRPRVFSDATEHASLKNGTGLFTCESSD